MRRLNFVLISLVLLCSVVSAGTVYLKDGRKFAGAVVEQTEDYIKIETGYGLLTIPRKDIEKIELKQVVAKLNNGKEFRGEIVSENQERIKLRTGYGTLTIPRGEVKEIKDKEEKLQEEEVKELRRKALQALQEKRFEDALDTYNRLLVSDPDNDIALYNTACAHSLMGANKKAVLYLDKAVRAGFIDFAHIERDADLDNIREETGYRQLIAEKEKIMAKAAHKRLESLEEKFGPDYTYEVDEKRKLIFVTNRSQAVVERLKRILTTYQDAQKRFLLKTTPTSYITVLSPSIEDYRKMVTNKAVGGYYNNATKTLVCRSIGYTLIHEFTHALHFADMHMKKQQHPIWIMEGLATCFESSVMENGLPKPMFNRRLFAVKDALKRNGHIPLQTMMRFSYSQFMSNAKLCYAEARYVMVYLYEMGKLPQWYEKYCTTYKLDRSGQKAMEEVIGKGIEEIDADWCRWASERKIPESSRVSKTPSLGIGTESTEEGVAITRVLHNSSAEAVGMKVGDIIVEIEGMQIDSRAMLSNMVRCYQVSDVIAIVVRRGRRELQLSVTLNPRTEEGNKKRKG